MNDHVDKILKKYKGLTDKGFDERVNALEEFYTNKDEQASVHISNAASDIHIGSDSIRGSYHAGRAALDTVAKDENMKMEKEDDLYKVIEAYVDQGLESILGKEKWGKFLKTNKDEQKLDEKAMRKAKGVLFAHYHRDREGRPVNPLDDASLKELKGKTKGKVKAQLRQWAQEHSGYLSSYYGHQAIKDLVTEDDFLDFAPYVHKKLTDAGWEHDDHASARSFQKNLGGYLTHLQGGEMSSEELGFRRKYEAKKE